MEQDEILDAPDNNIPRSSTPQSLFEIKFSSAAIYEELHEKMLNALRAISTNAGEKWEFTLAEENGVCVRAFRSDVEKGQDEREQSPDLTGIRELFQIDTSPAPKLDTVTVPSYKRAITDVLDEEFKQRKRQKTDENQCTRPSRSGPSGCFNCGSASHALRECPKQRNNNRINRAKKVFGTKQDRYHVDVEQRFAHIRPGEISKKLQSALGLRRGELPFFFYRMRILGYPPGWLEDAKVAHSGISLFNSNGVEVLESDEDDGEVDGTTHKYDVKKIIDFPGFNVNPGSNFYDDFEHYNVPPMDAQHMKEEFIKSLGNNITKGYKRKKLKDKSIADQSTLSNIGDSTADMELEDGDPTTQLPAESESSPLSPTEHAGIQPDPVEHPPSPSLAELEAQQEKLLLELQTSHTNPVVVEDESADNGAPVTPSKPNSVHISVTSPNPDSSGKAAIKESHQGTPLLKFSPYDKLPAGDNFKVGVSDVINFENLPDSTGKYEQMKLVIKKVRHIRNQLNDD